MTAAQVIEEFQRLPQAEKAKVVAFVNEAETSPKLRVAQDEEVAKVGETVFREHTELFQRLAE